MKKSSYIICLMSLLTFSSLAQNPLKGTIWIMQNSWTKVVYTFAENEFIYQVIRDGMDEADTLKIQKISVQEGIGKFVYKIEKEFDNGFYVIFFKNLEKDRILFYRVASTFDSLEDAWKTEFSSQKSRIGDVFFSPTYFEEYQKRPAMPEPDKKKIIEIFDIVIQKYKEAKSKGDTFSVNDFMNNWVEQQGYHASKSNEVFGNALQKYQSDPEIISRLNTLRELDK